MIKQRLLASDSSDLHSDSRCRSLGSMSRVPPLMAGIEQPNEMEWGQVHWLLIEAEGSDIKLKEISLIQCLWSCSSVV
jgi:hypothetical protein